MSVPILIVDDRRDVLELNRILLEAEGYQAAGYAYAELTPERLRESVPGVLLLDLVPGSDEPWDLLRRIHHDPETQGLSVVVTSDSPALVDRVMRDKDLHVAAGLVMPFDIEALYTAISGAAGGMPEGATGPTVSSPPQVILKKAIEKLRHRRSRILVRWVQRLSTLDSFRKNPTLSLAEIRGQGENLFDTIVDALELSATSQALTNGAVGGTVAASLDVPRQHGRLRRHQGVSVGDLAREMDALRIEIWQELYNNRTGEVVLSAEDVWELAGRLNNAFDEPLCATLESWSKDGDS